MGLNDHPGYLKKEIKVLIIDEVIKTLQEGISFGMCYAIEVAYLDYARQNGYGLKYNFAEQILPEMLDYKPQDLSIHAQYWFSKDKAGLDKRIEILKEIRQKLTS